MSRNKLKQIEEVRSFANVFGGEKQGGWPEKVVLELGCGWGQYTLELARRYPEKFFVGVDRKADRIWMGAKEALGSEKKVGVGGEFGEEALRNVAFLHTGIDKLDEWFEPESVEEIWITFPDPYPKPSKAEQRLISPRFQEIYRKICKPGAKIHLKTDNAALFDYALGVVGLCEEVIRDVHALDEVPDLLQVLTYYEKKFMEQGVAINYLRFTL